MCLMYSVMSHTFPKIPSCLSTSVHLQMSIPTACPRLGNVQMRSYRVGKCEKEDKTGHERYDIRLLKKKIIIVSELSKLAWERLD